jgi:hypothetical protein
MKEDYFGLTFILWQINLKAVFEDRNKKKGGRL